MRTIHKRALAAGITGVFAALMLTAGSCDTHSSAPEPSSDNIVDGSRTQVIRMPDGFRNVAFTCYGVNGLYVTSRGVIGNSNGDAVGSGIYVVPNDPHCVG